MTARQLTLDCESDWDDFPDDDIDPRLRDLRGQGLTAIQLNTIHDVELCGSYL